MIKRKLCRVKQAPQDVFVDRGILRVIAHEFSEAFYFLAGGPAAERVDEEFLNYFLGCSL